MTRLVEAKQGSAIPLYWQGEDNATLVEFDISEFIRDFGDGGIFDLLHIRCGDIIAYPCVVERVGDKLYWLVTEVDASKEGRGLCQIIYRHSTGKAKSPEFVTSVGKSLGNAGDVPEPWEPFQEAILQAAAEALLSASAAATSAQNAEISAGAAQAAAQSMSYVSFSFSIDGDLLLHNSEQLGTSNFTLTDEGNLEVTI